MSDFMNKALKRGNVFMNRLQDFCKAEKLNYLKVLCLLWEQDTGKKCQCGNHKKGIYGDTKIECEAQLVSIVSCSLQGSTLTKEDMDEFFVNLKKASDNNELD